MLNGRGGPERQCEQWHHSRACFKQQSSREDRGCLISHPAPKVSQPLLPAPAQELQLSRILAAPHGIWVPWAPASDETTNGTVSPDMGQQMKSSWIGGGKFEQCVQIFS